MQKLLVISLTAILIAGCSTTPNTDIEQTTDSNNDPATSQIHLEDFDPSSFSMKDYYEMSATTDKTAQIGNLTITNNGVTDHDLVSIADNLACQTYLDNAKKINLEVTNNYSEALDFRNSFTDIWGVSDVITDVTIASMDSGEFANNTTVLSDEFYGTLTPYFFQGDYLGTCFEQQNNLFVAQPGETVSYPMYFSLPDRWTEDAKIWYLSINPDTFMFPADSEFKELDTIQPIIFELDI